MSYKEKDNKPTNPPPKPPESRTVKGAQPDKGKKK